MDTQELERRISEARDAYYNLNPIMTDQAYDALIDELKRTKPDSPEVAAVGAAPPQFSVWEKVAHIIPMGSLDKVNSKEKFIEWAEGTKSDRFLMTHKIDGSSMEVVYSNGKLVRCVTRGDGKIGEDVTRNVSQIPNLPKTIEEDGEIVVRGEVVMTKEVFQKEYAEKYANPRNTAAGKVRDKKGGGTDCQNLLFLAYTMLCENRPPTEEGQFMVLKDLGFEVPTYFCGRARDMAEYFETVKTYRADVPYEIDGMVVRVDLIEAQESLGEHNMRPKGQTAWKFDSATAKTKVLDVRWQVGPSGRVTPVASVEPVSVGGVTITSISLHNISLFNDLALYPGCEVLVSRRNDVIPYIEQRL